MYLHAHFNDGVIYLSSTTSLAPLTLWYIYANFCPIRDLARARALFSAEFILLYNASTNTTTTIHNDFKILNVCLHHSAMIENCIKKSSEPVNRARARRERCTTYIGMRIYIDRELPRLNGLIRYIERYIRISCLCI